MEDQRKCEKCGADVCINDMYCPQCGSPQPVRFHYDSYKTSMYDASMSTGLAYVPKSVRLKSINYENGVLTVSNLAGEELSGPLKSYDQVFRGKTKNPENTIVRCAKGNQEIGLYAEGADLYPQDWEHILLSLEKIGATKGDTMFVNKSTRKWSLLACGIVFAFVVVLIMGAYLGIFEF